MENIITILVVGILNVVCFLFGAKVGMSVVKGEPIELPSLPSINLLKAYREREERKEAEEKERSKQGMSTPSMPSFRMPSDMPHF